MLNNIHPYIKLLPLVKKTSAGVSSLSRRTETQYQVYTYYIVKVGHGGLSTANT